MLGQASEIGPVAARAMARLFPESQGALMLLSPSKTDLETVSRWGGFPEDLDENLFAPDACWALRRGSSHLVENLRNRCHLPPRQARPRSRVRLPPADGQGRRAGPAAHPAPRASGRAVEALRSATRIKDLAATVSGILSLSIWNMRLRETLANQAIKDPLTGLFNRAFMEDSLQREIYRAGRKQAQIAVIMVDIDHFKKFNDVHGHAAGDVVLCEIANYLRWKVRKGDIVCRYGGEEFALILPESTLEDSASAPIRCGKA